MQEEISICALPWPATGSHEGQRSSQHVSVRRALESVLTLDWSSLAPAAMQSWDIFLRFAYMSHHVPSVDRSSEFNSYHNSLLLTYVASIPTVLQSRGKQGFGPEFYLNLTYSKKGPHQVLQLCFTDFPLDFQVYIKVPQWKLESSSPVLNPVI